MMLIDIFKNTTWKNVEIQLKKHYKEYSKKTNNLVGLKKAYNECCNTEPFTNEKQSLDIVIEYVFDEIESFYHVYGSEKSSKDKINWGLVYLPWGEWLSSEIDLDTLKEYTYDEIIAHCLYEMTFHGFSNGQVQKKAKKVYRRL